MGWDIPLGKIFGIKVGMNPMALLMAVLFAVLLHTTLYPHQVEGLSEAAYWTASIASGLLFLISLLIHELGHALVARDEGIGVQSMGLTMLGGVTRMDSSPTTPGAEFRVSVVGPVASAVCGVVFSIGAFLLPEHGTLGLMGAVYAWLGFVNLYLAVINMVPAAPLDGGKVLSSTIWRATGDQSLALTWSAAAGIVVGMALSAWGFREMANAPDLLQNRVAITALSALVIGVFIALSAYQQLRSAPLFRALDGLTVDQVMAAGPPTAASWSTVGEFLRSNDPKPEHQAYPVVGPDGQVIGLLTAAAIRAVPASRWDKLPVPDLAYPLDRLLLVRSDEPLLPALQKIENADVHTGLVVTPDGRIVGTLDPSAMHRGVGMAKAERRPLRV